MMTSRMTAVSAHAAVNPVISELIIRLLFSDLATASEVSIVSVCICPHSARYTPHEQFCDAVDNGSDQEKDQPDLDKGAQVHLVGSVSEVTREYRCDRVCGFEKRRRDLRRVADHHRHGHRFAYGPPETEHDRPGYSRGCVRKDDLCGFP